MRAWLFLALAACSPSIATGDYLCGPEEACPEGQVCNGPDNTCVIPTSATAYTCAPSLQDPAHANMLGTLGCVSQPLDIEGCLASNDHGNWYAFGTRPECTSQALTASVAAPIAFEGITVELYDATGATKLATADDSCTSAQPPDISGETTLCLAQMLVPGSSYMLHVTPTGAGTCGGNCAFNRYRLNGQTMLH